ncbi:MAG: LysM peptidoglycan-binding domain-containing protein [Chloroflexi bacterium]|nr:LysM peptidoglycan-binding domain-containing protein [Chloroflexota bacterium]
MKPVLRVLLITVSLAILLSRVPPISAASPGIVVVNWGDTLHAIAARNGTTVEALVRANSLPNSNFIWAGQRLIIPSSSSAPANPAPVTSVYTVARGDTLATIAARFGTTVDALARANGLYNPNFIWTGQRLNVPGRSAPPAPQPGPAPANPPKPGNTAPAPTTGKWIDINISTQTITAFEGTTALKSVLVSTGLAWTPTPIGRYKVYLKVASQTMRGGSGASYYYLPGVPSVMYFTGAYAIHGTYWHRNFGKPMSHGCVNLTIEDAKWFYNWAEIGTPVVTHL